VYHVRKGTATWEGVAVAENVEEPSEWVGERVRAFMDPAEEVQGVLKAVTDHGVVIDVGARRRQGPFFYSWQMVRWIYPIDRQTINEDH
jgi:hypothetical protein